MATSNAHAQWKGKIKEGKGNLSFTGFTGAYSYETRFENASGTNPEELIGAAHAGCYSMYLSLLLTEEGLDPESIDTKATVTIHKDDTGPYISEISLDCKVKCEGLDERTLKKLADSTKENCPVSRLYKGGSAKIVAQAQLVK